MARLGAPRLLLAAACLLAMVGRSMEDQVVGVEFSLEIDGMEVSAKDLDGVEIDDIEIEPIAMAPTADGEALVYCPGTAKYGNVAIRAVPGSVLAGDLYQWWLDCSQGKNIRKSMSVIALKTDGAVGRRFNLLDTWPMRWEAADLRSNSADCETVVCTIGRVELPLSDDFTEFPEEAYRILITGGPVKEQVDAAWTVKEGGAQQLVEVPGEACADAAILSNTVSELRLRGPLTAGRQALCQWITAATAPDEALAAGDKEISALDAEIEAAEAELKKAKLEKRLQDEAKRKRQVNLRANVPGDSSSYAYDECIPTRYSFPSFSTSETGLLEEKLSFKPLRLTVT